MELILDTANLEKIARAIDLYPISGVTTNPSIFKKENTTDFFGHFKAIRQLIGFERSLHIQVVGESAQAILDDAKAILEKVDKEVYIKIPSTPQGIKAMKILKAQGVHVTATAIYSKLQAHMTVLAGVDYLAPYVNRMDNLDIDPIESMKAMVAFIDQSNAKTKIVAASFKNLTQINDAINCGVQAITVDPDLIDEIFKFPSLAKAVSDFKSDFESRFGEGATIASLT
jgi:TalC/MipB family fructose-6-phosphate aldolase